MKRILAQYEDNPIMKFISRLSFVFICATLVVSVLIAFRGTSSPASPLHVTEVSILKYASDLPHYAGAHGGVFPSTLQDLENDGYFSEKDGQNPNSYYEAETGMYYDWLYFGAFHTLNDASNTILVASPRSFTVGKTGQAREVRAVVLLNGQVKAISNADFIKQIKDQMQQAVMAKGTNH